MFYDKNIAALLQGNSFHKDLVERLQDVKATQDIEVYESKDGGITLKYRDVLLHDIEGPAQEAQQVVETSCTPLLDRCHLVLGLGLGYVVEAAFKFTPGRIFVYEPDLLFMKFVLENVDLSDYFISGRVWLVDMKFDLYDQMKAKITWADQLDVVTLRSYAYLMSDEVSELMTRFMDLMRNRVRDYNTCKHFHYQWIKQLFNNYAQFPLVSTLDPYVGKFKGKPALVVSRGPSLDAAIDDLKELADSVVLIAIGGALSHLWKKGIIPDFVLFYDANGMKEQMHGIPPEVLEKITFVMSPFTQKCCFETPSRGKIVFLADNNVQIAQWFDKVYGREHYRLAGGITVSIVAFQFALAMECSKIILVGQDLAFPNDTVYAGGMKVNIDERGLLALPSSETLFAVPQRMGQVKGQDGEMMRTTEAFADIVMHFQEAVYNLRRKGTPVELYNASIGGANIEGFELRALREFIGELSPWKAPFALEEDPNPSEKVFNEKKKALINGVKSFKKAIKKSIRSFNEIIRIMPSLENEDVESYTEEQTQNLLDILRRENSRFYQFVRENDFVSYMLTLEVINYRRRFDEYVNKPYMAVKSLLALQMMLHSSVKILELHVLPAVEQAEKDIEAVTYAQRLPQADLPEPLQVGSPESPEEASQQDVSKIPAKSA